MMTQFLIFFSDGLFDNWLGGQLPVPSWSPLILPDEILSEELSPQSPTPTEVCFIQSYQLSCLFTRKLNICNNGFLKIFLFPQDGQRNNNNYDDTDNEGESNKSSTTSTPSNALTLTIPTHPGCRGGHQMIMDSRNQV